jgi:signal transduction histidine kinase
LEAIAGVIAAIRNQYDRFLLLDAERTRIAREMHDEIGSGLTHISMLVDTIHQDAGTEHSLIAHKLSAVSRELVQNMGEIIWSLNPEHSSLERLLVYLREQANRFLEPSGIVYTINFPEAVPHVVLSNVQRRNLYLTVKEAINNALKYAAADQLDISAQVGKEAIALCVSDNGSGFAMAQVRQSANGLRNMQRRMEEIGGVLVLQSARGKGTNVLCSLPLHLVPELEAPAKVATSTTFM